MRILFHFFLHENDFFLLSNRKIKLTFAFFLFDRLLTKSNSTDVTTKLQCVYKCVRLIGDYLRRTIARISQWFV